MVFSVVMYGCECWTIKKAKHWRIDAFALWCWRLLRRPWTARRSNQLVNRKGNQSWIFIGRTNAEAEALILGPRDTKNILSFPASGYFPIKRRKWRQRMRWLDVITTQWTWVWASSRRWWKTGNPCMLQSMGSQRFGHHRMTEQQQPLWPSAHEEPSRLAHPNLKHEQV